MIIAILILLGLCLGSFVNAFVWRLYQQSLPAKKRAAKKVDLSISKGRSMCVHCGHTLQAVDLIPILSWIGLRGKCRYCRRQISWQYPLVELTMAVLFVGSYLLWPNEITGWEIVNFSLWLVSLVAFMSLVIYDLRWMLLPNRIIFPMYGVATAAVLSRVAQDMSFKPLLDSLAGLLVGGGIFYVLFQLSGGRWIGGGDVKLGFLLGVLLGDPLQSALMLFGASLLGTIFTTPLLVSGRAKRDSRIPFGPFLIIAAVLVQLFGSSLIEWYTASFIDI